jgi:hypothetical protein
MKPVEVCGKSCAPHRQLTTNKAVTKIDLMIKRIAIQNVLKENLASIDTTYGVLIFIAFIEMTINC